jgi:LmbE family N-acetylglucosaminyl deacetylase
MRLDEIPLSNLISAVEAIFLKIMPYTVILPFMHDPHSDHRYAFAAAYSCTKHFRHLYVKRILMMETPSETDYAPQIPGQAFCPTFFVDTSRYMARKKEILSLYGEEVGLHPFPRSLRGVNALSIVRGAACGCEYAEAFMPLKEIF